MLDVQISWNVADGKSCVIYRTETKQNFGCLSNCCYCADRAQNLPGPAPNNVLTVLQISSKLVHFRRSYSRTREHCFCPVEYFQDSHIESITKLKLVVGPKYITVHKRLVRIWIGSKEGWISKKYQLQILYWITTIGVCLSGILRKWRD